MGIVKRLGVVVLLLLGALTLSWVLPFFYHLAFDREYDVPFSVYSGVTGTFAILGGAEHRYADDAGRVYTRAQFDSILLGSTIASWPWMGGSQTHFTGSRSPWRRWSGASLYSIASRRRSTG